MSKVKCGLIQMGLKGDGTMSPEKIRDLMIEAHIPMIEDAAKQGVKVLCFQEVFTQPYFCLLYTSPSPRDRTRSRMPSSA